MVTEGADINSQNRKDYNTTPLMYAGAKGHLNRVMCLLNPSANPNRVDICNTSALYKAVTKRRWEASLALIQAGARISTGSLKTATTESREAVSWLINEFR